MFYNDRTCREDVDINITNQNTNTNYNENTNMNFNEIPENYNMTMPEDNMMMPIIEDIADSDVGVYVCRADIDDLPEICEKYEVRSVPTLILFNEGKPMARMTGYHTEEEIFSFLHTYGF